MDVCRICLSTAPEKDINFLNTRHKGYKEIWYFCLEIQVPDDPKLRKLCLKCYKKVLSFYKFKTLAQKNDAYLRALNPDFIVKLEHIATSIVEGVNDNEHPSSEIKEEPEVKTEDPEYQSDDELLSVLQNEKYETSSNAEDRKENSFVRKRGRKKSKQAIQGLKKKEVCDECGKYVWNLKLHAIRHVPRQERALLKCRDCDKTFSSYGARSKHYKIKHLGLKQHCNICNKDVVLLRVHNLVTHNKEALPLGCMLCDRRFLNASGLDLHMLSHTKQRPQECDVCHKKFRMKLTMLSHKRQVHDKERSHLCQYCSKSFFKKSQLQIHLRRHTKEKPYKCTECDKCFVSPTGRKNHMMTHTGERKYSCEYCQMTFAKSGNMRTHLLTHTKVKIHACKYCGVKFGRTDHRKRHEYTAHEKYLLTSA